MVAHGLTTNGSSVGEALAARMSVTTSSCDWPKYLLSILSSAVSLESFDGRCDALAWNPLIDAVASRISALWDLQLPAKDKLIHFGFVALHSFVTLLTTSRRLVMLFVVTIRFDHLLFFC